MLSVKKIEKLTSARRTKKSKKQRYRDERGLYLQIVGNSFTWLLRYKRNKREHWMGLGPLAEVDLDAARKRARLERQLVREGRDPIEARRAERTQRELEAAQSITFAEACEKFLDSHGDQWGKKHRVQFSATLERYANPVLGHLPVSAIGKREVLRVLEPIWRTKTETAARLRGRIEAVLAWAAANDYRSRDNPASWKDNLAAALPSPGKIAEVKHHAALPYDQMPAFMAALRAQDGIAARALEFTILTAVRTGDIVGNPRDDKPPMLWSHVDQAARTWTIPRTKTETELRVPLSDRALALLGEGGDGPVFGLSKNAMGAVIGRMGGGWVDPKQGGRVITVHGFRSTFRDWASEMTSYAPHVVEMALAHAIGDKVEAAYRRGDLFEKRTRLMADWAAYCSALPAAEGANVTPIRRG